MLPTLVAPTHEVKLYSLKKPIKMRPYLVAEEKIFLTAKQSGDKTEIENAVKQVIRNVTDGAVDVEKLPSFDLEYLFLKMRARSVNNIIEVPFKCNMPAEGGTCSGQHTVRIDIDDIKLTVPPDHTNKFMISDDIGVTLRYPTLAAIEGFLQDRSNADTSTLLKETIDTVFTKDGKVHEMSEASPEERDTFVNSFSVGQVEKLKVFFETMPRLTYTFDFKCPKCQYTEPVTIQGLLDFFV